jgi:ABC-type cobalt transport system substrate-binding protein
LERRVISSVTRIVLQGNENSYKPWARKALWNEPCGELTSRCKGMMKKLAVL